MTFLADLRDLAQRRTDAEFCPNREFVKLDPVAEDVFRKSAREERYADLLLQAIHALFAEQADLAVPVSRVGVSIDPVFRPQMDRFDRVLLLPLLFTDADSRDNSGLIAHEQCLPSNTHSKWFCTSFPIVLYEIMERTRK